MNNLGLVEHAKKALLEHWGYVWGTFGQVLTPTLYEQKLRQYPTIKFYDKFIRSNWIGKISVDCVGLIKSYYWTENGELKYNSSTDVSADGMFNRATEKGSIDTIPEISGLILWKKGHVGIYIGNEKVIESHGTKYGVIQTPLRGTGATAWTHWLKCPYIDYIAVPQKDSALDKNDSENLEYKVEREINNMQIKDLQHVCNVLGIKDYEGKALVEDNLSGKRTESARAKLKEIITYILK